MADRLPQYHYPGRSNVTTTQQAKGLLGKMLGGRPERCIKRLLRWLLIVSITSIGLNIFGLCNLPQNTVERFAPIFKAHPPEKANEPWQPKDQFIKEPMIPKIPETVASVAKVPKVVDPNAPDLVQPDRHPSAVEIKADKGEKKEQVKVEVDNPIKDFDFKDYADKQANSLNAAAKVLAVSADVKKAQESVVVQQVDNAKAAFNKHLKKSEIEPYDRSRGTPTDPDILSKRDFIKGMVKHAWDGYVKYAWTFNELRPVTHKGHSQNIFGNANTGATIIDAMDTLYLMGLDEEFDKAKRWLHDEFKFNSKTEVSVFETNIRFIGGLVSLYYLTGDALFKERAKEITDILLPAFDTPTGLPYATYNPSNGKKKNFAWASAGCSILSEFGTLHLEFGTLSHLTGNNIYLDKVVKIREFLRNMKRPDSGVWYNYINPTTGQFGTTKAASVGALGDSFYEYLIKTHALTDGSDTVALEMWEDAMRGVKNDLLRKGPGEHWYLGELKRTRLEPKMGHLTCFAGGMFAMGSKYVAKDKEYWMDMAQNIGETCHQSYTKTPTGLGPESFRFDNANEAAKANSKREKYYILRPEVIETYFYLWRYTKDPKWRAYGWEAAQALDKYCKTDAGYSGIKDVYQMPPVLDDLQQSFVLAETFKYLYLLFSDDDLLSLDEWVFNTEAHPLKIIKNWGGEDAR